MRSMFLIALLLVAACADDQGPEFPVPGVSGKLAFTTRVNQSGGTSPSELHVMDLATGDSRVIFLTRSDEVITSVTWHPSGRSLVIATMSGDIINGPVVFALKKMNDDGTGLVSAFDGNGPESVASYSPQGALAYCAFDGSLGSHVLYVDGSLLWPGCNQNTAPSWFPDGSAVALAAGGGLLRVERATKTASLFFMDPPATNLGDPAVSPQADLIAVKALDGSGAHILLVRPDGTISATLPGGNNPQWSTDGSLLMSLVGATVYVRELASGKVQAIPGAFGGPIAWYPQ